MLIAFQTEDMQAEAIDVAQEAMAKFTIEKVSSPHLSLVSPVMRKASADIWIVLTFVL